MRQCIHFLSSLVRIFISFIVICSVPFLLMSCQPQDSISLGRSHVLPALKVMDVNGEVFDTSDIMNDTIILIDYDDSLDMLPLINEIAKYKQDYSYDIDVIVFCSDKYDFNDCRIIHNNDAVLEMKLKMNSNNFIFLKNNEIMFQGMYDKRVYAGVFLAAVHCILNGYPSMLDFMQLNRPENYILMNEIFSEFFGEDELYVDTLNYILIVSKPDTSCDYHKMIKLFDDMASTSGAILLHPNLSPDDTKHIKYNHNLKGSVKYSNEQIASYIRELDKKNFGVLSNIFCVYQGGKFIESYYVDENCDVLYDSLAK